MIVKATFALVPGEAIVAPEQDPLSRGAPLGRQRDGQPPLPRGLRALQAARRRRAGGPRVLPPRGEPVTSLSRALAVGEMVKAVRVTGDRVWTLGRDDVARARPARAPSCACRSATSAPRSAPTTPSASTSTGRRCRALPALPNLERADAGSRGATPCFGPVAPTWRARRRLLDDEADVLGLRHRARPAPSGGHGPAPHRPRAPPLRLRLLQRGPRRPAARPAPPRHAPHARLTCTPGTRCWRRASPRCAPRSSACRPPDTPRARVEEIALRCDTLWIDTDRAVAVVTWRGLADVGRSAEGVGRVIVAADPQGKKLRWDRVEKLLGDQALPTLRLGPDGQVPPEEPEENAPDPLAVRHDTVKSQRTGNDGGNEGGHQGRPAPEAPDSGAWDLPTNPLERDDDDCTHALPELTPRPPGPPARPAVARPTVVLPPVLLGGAPRPPVALSPEAGKHPAVEVDVATYARLQVAVERGEVGRMLADLQLTLSDSGAPPGGVGPARGRVSPRRRGARPRGRGGPREGLRRGPLPGPSPKRSSSAPGGPCPALKGGAGRGKPGGAALTPRQGCALGQRAANARLFTGKPDSSKNAGFCRRKPGCAVESRFFP